MIAGARRKSTDRRGPCPPWTGYSRIMAPGERPASRRGAAWLAAVGILLVTAAGGAAAGNGDLTVVEIPAGRPVQVDGVLAAGEWDDAAALAIPIAPGWDVRVLLKHDAGNLYFAFTHLRHAGAERYPEVLL